MPNAIFGTLLSFFSFFGSLTTFSQENNYEYVPLNRSGSTFVVNNLASLGNTRASMRIDLPENTICWFYAITVKKGNTKNTVINLIGQLSKAVDNSGTTKAALQYITSPKGDAKCDIFLLDQKNNTLFLEKADKNIFTSTTYSYYPVASIQSISETEMYVGSPFIYGTYYLGIRNPSSEIIYVTIEAVAVVKKVKEKVVKNNWYAEQGAFLRIVQVKEMIATMIKADKDSLPNDSKIRTEISECTLNKLMTKYKMSEFASLDYYNKKQAILPEYKECATKHYDASLGEERATEDKAFTYGNLGWTYFEKGDIDKCVEYSQKSIALKPFFFATANLGLCYLLQGKESDAIETYVESLGVLKKASYPRSNKRTELLAAIKDIEDQMSKNSSLKGAAEVLTLLKAELNGL